MSRSRVPPNVFANSVECVRSCERLRDGGDVECRSDSPAKLSRPQKRRRRMQVLAASRADGKAKGSLTADTSGKKSDLGFEKKVIKSLEEIASRLNSIETGLSYGWSFTPASGEFVQAAFGSEFPHHAQTANVSEFSDTGDFGIPSNSIEHFAFDPRTAPFIPDAALGGGKFMSADFMEHSSVDKEGVDETRTVATPRLNREDDCAEKSGLDGSEDNESEDNPLCGYCKMPCDIYEGDVYEGDACELCLAPHHTRCLVPVVLRQGKRDVCRPCASSTRSLSCDFRILPKAAWQSIYNRFQLAERIEKHQGGASTSSATADPATAGLQYRLDTMLSYLEMVNAGKIKLAPEKYELLMATLKSTLAWNKLDRSIDDEKRRVEQIDSIMAQL